jgi:hypothetical protein
MTILVCWTWSRTRGIFNYIDIMQGYGYIWGYEDYDLVLYCCVVRWRKQACRLLITCLLIGLPFDSEAGGGMFHQAAGEHLPNHMTLQTRKQHSAFYGVIQCLRWRAVCAYTGQEAGWAPEFFLHTVLLLEADCSPPASAEVKNGGGKPPLLHMYSWHSA